MNRTLTTILVALLLVPGTMVLAPARAHATIFSDIATNSLVAKEYVLDGIAWQIRTLLVHSLVRSTVNWINRGFNGSPAYATNLKETLLDAADQEAAGFVRSLTSGSLLNLPFQDKIAQRALTAYYLSSSKDSFALRNPYTLNQVSPDDRAFIDGDFTKGGLSAWLTATLNPQNTPIGFQDLVDSRLNQGVSGVTGQINQEYAVGGGFFPFRKCDEEKTTFIEKDKTTTITNLDGKTEQLTTFNLTPKKTCLRSRIETPGALILEAGKKAGLTSIDQVLTADELNEVIGALMGQLTNKIFGSSGFRGVSSGSSASGGRSFLDTATDSSQITQGQSGVDLSTISLVGETQIVTQTYRTNWQMVTAAAEGARTAVTQSACLNKETIITEQVLPVIARAKTATERADGILARIEAIKSEFVTAQVGGAAAKSAGEAMVNEAYQTLLRDIPTTTELDESTRESNDSAGAIPESLYTKMTRLAQLKCGT